MMFPVMLIIVGADTVYPVGNLHFASTFDQDSQSLAGGIFNVATRVSSSLLFLLQQYLIYIFNSLVLLLDWQLAPASLLRYPRNTMPKTLHWQLIRPRSSWLVSELPAGHALLLAP